MFRLPAARLVPSSGLECCDCCTATSSRGRSEEPQVSARAQLLKGTWKEKTFLDYLFRLISIPSQRSTVSRPHSHMNVRNSYSSEKKTENHEIYK